jgi:hypothetical protein
MVLFAIERSWAATIAGDLRSSHRSFPWEAQRIERPLAGCAGDRCRVRSAICISTPSLSPPDAAHLRARCRRHAAAIGASAKRSNLAVETLEQLPVVARSWTSTCVPDETPPEGGSSLPAGPSWSGVTQIAEGETFKTSRFGRLVLDEPVEGGSSERSALRCGEDEPVGTARVQPDVLGDREGDEARHSDQRMGASGLGLSPDEVAGLDQLLVDTNPATRRSRRSRRKSTSSQKRRNLWTCQRRRPPPRDRTQLRTVCWVHVAVIA